MRDLFYTFSIRKAPFRRVGGGGRVGLTRYRDPQECNVLFILVYSKDFPESAKPYAYMVRDSPPGGATCCVGFPRTPIPTPGLCQEVNGLEISIALER